MACIWTCYIYLSMQFVHACELKRHTNWTQSLEFSLPVRFSEEATSVLLVKIILRQSHTHMEACFSKTQGTYSKDEISLAFYTEGPVFVAGTPLTRYQWNLFQLVTRIGWTQ